MPALLRGARPRPGKGEKAGSAQCSRRGRRQEEARWEGRRVRQIHRGTDKPKCLNDTQPDASRGSSPAPRSSPAQSSRKQHVSFHEAGGEEEKAAAG